MGDKGWQIGHVSPTAFKIGCGVLLGFKYLFGCLESFKITAVLSIANNSGIIILLQGKRASLLVNAIGLIQNLLMQTNNVAKTKKFLWQVPNLVRFFVLIS